LPVCSLNAVLLLLRRGRSLSLPLHQRRGVAAARDRGRRYRSAGWDARCVVLRHMQSSAGSRRSAKTWRCKHEASAPVAQQAMVLRWARANVGCELRLLARLGAAAGGSSWPHSAPARDVRRRANAGPRLSFSPPSLLRRRTLPDALSAGSWLALSSGTPRSAITLSTSASSGAAMHGAVAGAAAPGVARTSRAASQSSTPVPAASQARTSTSLTERQGYK
jgi:hypothetical protein